jgi:hypothetical protein
VPNTTRRDKFTHSPARFGKSFPSKKGNVRDTDARRHRELKRYDRKPSSTIRSFRHPKDFTDSDSSHWSAVIYGYAEATLDPGDSPSIVWREISSLNHRHHRAILDLVTSIFDSIEKNSCHSRY